MDPELRKKLLQESKNPLKGVRRVLWFALFGSASIGLLIMLLRTFAGENVEINDFLIQAFAFLLFGYLVTRDRKKIDE